MQIALEEEIEWNRAEYSERVNVKWASRRKVPNYLMVRRN